MERLILLGLVGLLLTFTGTAFAAELPEACSSQVAAVTGGPMPPSESDIVVVRWLGNANFEFAYKGKVYLFDAYFDRTPRSHNIGVAAKDVKKAEGIFVSHAHFDHIADIGPVARQTGARVVGAPITIDTARKLGAPEQQLVVARGGESLKFGDATIEVALAQHSTIQAGLIGIYSSLYKNDSPAFTEEETKELARVQALGTFDPKVITEGTLAFAFVLPSGFKAVLIGSSGPITPGVRALAEKLGPVDVLSLPTRCTRWPTRRSAIRGRSSSCSNRSCTFPPTTTRHRRPGLTLALSRCSTKSAPKCRARHSSRRFIVRRSASLAQGPIRGRWLGSSTDRGMRSEPVPA